MGKAVVPESLPRYPPLLHEAVESFQVQLIKRMYNSLPQETLIATVGL